MGIRLSLLGKNSKVKWKTKDGKYIPINLLEDQHIINIIKMFQCRSISSKLDLYSDLIKEAKRRKLTIPEGRHRPPKNKGYVFFSNWIYEDQLEEETPIWERDWRTSDEIWNEICPHDFDWTGN